MDRRSHRHSEAAASNTSDENRTKQTQKIEKKKRLVDFNRSAQRVLVPSLDENKLYFKPS